MNTPTKAERDAILAAWNAMVTAWKVDRWAQTTALRAYIQSCTRLLDVFPSAELGYRVAKGA